MLIGRYVAAVRAHYALVEPHSLVRRAAARAQRGANMLGLVLGAVVALVIFALVLLLFRR
jgi:hypothetical protein